MPQGLQVFDAAGKTVLDTNFRAAKILGVVTAGAGVTTVNDVRLTQGEPFAFNRIEGTAAMFDSFSVNAQMSCPIFAFSGATMTITRPGTSVGGVYPCTVYYGIL